MYFKQMNELLGNSGFIWRRRLSFHAGSGSLALGIGKSESTDEEGGAAYEGGRQQKP